MLLSSYIVLILYYKYYKSFNNPNSNPNPVLYYEDLVKFLVRIYMPYMWQK